MRITMKDGQIVLGDMGAYYGALRSWGLLTYHKPTQTLRGAVSLELLDNLSGLGRLPREIEAERQRLRAVKEAIDAERGNEHPVPLVHYPVKAKLFEHQIRGCNLALLTFGVVDPQTAERRNRDASTL